MKKIYFISSFLVLLITFLITCSFDPFSDYDNPSVFYHVDVVSGNFALKMEDASVQAPMPFSLERIYSSSGALENSKFNSILNHYQGPFPPRKGWIRRGWNFLPHLHMIYEKSVTEGSHVYVPDKNGNMTMYTCTDYNSKTDVAFYQIKNKKSPNYTALSGKFNYANNHVVIQKHKSPIHLTLSDGTICEYKLTAPRKIWCTLRLEREILPNQHQIVYEYDKKDRLIHIDLKNPSGTKIYGWIHLDLWDASDHFHYQLRTSDNKRMEYKAIEHENEAYLTHIINDDKPEEKYGFLPSRKGCGLRIHDLYLNKHLQFKINYYCPSDMKQERKWAEHPNQIELPIDKVESIQIPGDKEKELITVAKYQYFPNCTEIRDAEIFS